MEHQARQIPKKEIGRNPALIAKSTAVDPRQLSNMCNTAGVIKQGKLTGICGYSIVGDDGYCGAGKEFECNKKIPLKRS